MLRLDWSPQDGRNHGELRPTGVLLVGGWISCNFSGPNIDPSWILPARCCRTQGTDVRSTTACIHRSLASLSRSLRYRCQPWQLHFGRRADQRLEVTHRPTTSARTPIESGQSTIWRVHLSSLVPDRKIHESVHRSSYLTTQRRSSGSDPALHVAGPQCQRGVNRSWLPSKFLHDKHMAAGMPPSLCARHTVLGHQIGSWVGLRTRTDFRLLHRGARSGRPCVQAPSITPDTGPRSEEEPCGAASTQACHSKSCNSSRSRFTGLPTARRPLPLHCH